MSDVLVFGRTGQVARELQRLAPVLALGRDAADLAQAEVCAAAIHAHRPRAVINAAAYTAVDRAEREEGLSAHGNNFVKTMLRLSDTHDELRVVDDQYGGPTPARAIAAAALAIARELQKDAQKTGTYHLSGAPDTSWCSFARAIFAAAGRPTRVQGIPTSAYRLRDIRQQSQGHVYRC